MSPLAVREPIDGASFPLQPGTYVVWEDHDDGRPLYVGVAATQTIAQRWLRQHLYPRAGGSALRRTLGVWLGLVPDKLRRPARYYPSDVEAAITSFLERCLIEFHPTDEAGAARQLEVELIGELNPVLMCRGRGSKE